ncbi:hypothetical protein BS50DRAFT_635445 [Corynespora cassiicola Philippines]|uniref:SRP9 domain-containing protein n=1 Tax=Corynespora cassiicola Philippines TaxID=1448308 RepID=A0A2T2NLI7_CORCC|nr:hypothetical protein BS50DRAFT_635445 [Corynespora cassiicola Philippines]
MPYFKTSTEWYEQSSLLLKARPTSTRITSKYTVLKPTPSKIKKRQKYADKQASKPASDRPSSPAPQAQNPEEPTATFTLKTYDPESGTCLQYVTTKGAEVGRLVGSLGRLSRHMAAMPEIAEDLGASAEGPSTPQVEADVQMGGTAPAEPKAGGGGKKKKKGKK